MKINDARITMLFNPHGATIEIEDGNANTIIVSVTLNQEELCKILSRQGGVSCKCEIGNLSRVGKTHENKSFEFELPEDIGRFNFNNKKDELLLICKEALIAQNMEEWISDNSYSSQNSFFKVGDKNYARVTIRRWI